MKLYMKLFLGTGIPFGVTMGTMAGLKGGLSVGISSGSMQGLFFGLIMSLVLGTFHKMKTKGMSSKKGDDVGPNQTRTVTIVDSVESAFEKCLQALGSIKANVTENNKENGTITAKTSMSWKSFGEEIRISLIKDDSGKIQVTVSSAPKLKTTLVDYGRGRQNVTSLIEFINS
ncbi:MAG: hypothetical protein KAS04_05055 [Candidatus Aenigmarchaeota archaeon]|nr:hypothetical protein [Candidatus Aenigmarchaeota archaeon]